MRGNANAFVVKWDSIISLSFNVSNGVRQGGVLSPILFNLFIEDLSQRLLDTRVGCYMNHVCFNHINYADDCVLLAPSVPALQILINVCNSYASQFDMIYNCKKSLCMSFYPKGFYNSITPNVILGGTCLRWTDQHKYLGVNISCDSKDDIDIKRQCKAIYSRGNMLIRKFKTCSDNVKCQLFKSYMSNLYCGQLWSNYSSRTFKRVKVAYNNVCRSLFSLKRDCSISKHFVDNNIHGFDSLLRIYINSFSKRILVCDNLLVSTVANSTYFIYKSKLFSKWVSLTHSLHV